MSFVSPMSAVMTAATRSTTIMALVNWSSSSRQAGRCFFSTSSLGPIALRGAQLRPRPAVPGSARVSRAAATAAASTARAGSVSDGSGGRGRDRTLLAMAPWLGRPGQGPHGPAGRQRSGTGGLPRIVCRSPQERSRACRRSRSGDREDLLAPVRTVDDLAPVSSRRSASSRGTCAQTRAPSLRTARRAPRSPGRRPARSSPRWRSRRARCRMSMSCGRT